MVDIQRQYWIIWHFGGWQNIQCGERIYIDDRILTFNRITAIGKPALFLNVFSHRRFYKKYYIFKTFCKDDVLGKYFILEIFYLHASICYICTWMNIFNRSSDTLPGTSNVIVSILWNKTYVIETLKICQKFHQSKLCEHLKSPNSFQK